MGIRLDIGCGANRQDGWTGMDVRPLPNVDIVWDVTRFPWPLEDESVVLATASHLVEHIPPVMIGPEGTWFPFMRFMDEVWRVLEPHGQFAIVTPHGSSQGFLQDPTHCNPCNETTWAYFDPLETRANGLLYGIYKPKPWHLKFISWNPAANIEVILVKRPLDLDGERVEVHYE